MVKPVFLFIFISIFFLFCFTIVPSAFAQYPYACNQDCSLNHSGCTPPNTCINIASLGWRCRLDECITQSDCACDAYTVQGLRVLMPGNQQGIVPFRDIDVSANPAGGTYTEEDPAVRARKAYYWSGMDGGTSYTFSVSPPSGSTVEYTACYNTTSCHSGTRTASSSFVSDTNRVDSENYVSGGHYIDLWWHFTPQIPNCKNIKVNGQVGPATILTGDNVILNADFETGYGLTQIGLGAFNNSTGCLGSWSLNHTLVTSTPGNYSSSTWTTSAAGTYTALCRAWNDSIAECRGTCVDAPPRYQCAGTDGAGATTTTTITVTNPEPWYKLKDLSLYKTDDIDVSIPVNVKDFSASNDPDDDAGRYIIIGQAGIGSVYGTYNPGPSYNPITLSLNNWHNSSYTLTRSFINDFIDYIKARKSYISITNKSEIQSNTVNFINGPITIDDTWLTNTPFVLMVTGNVTINSANFNNASSPVAIIASGTITFTAAVNYANGIFIANQAVVGGSGAAATDTFGIKIKGNLISTQPLNSSRNRTDNTRPSIFVVMDTSQYISLLSLISTSKYDFQQTQ